MGPTQILLYNIFLASPQDVAQERRRFYEAVKMTNQMLANARFPAQLRVFGWEQIPPELGLPEAVILREIPMEQCDIFVAIFGKRFGFPPGTARLDGTPYLAGTEQEIEEAIRIRNQSSRNRPSIMIFWKTDPIPSNMPSEDFEQLCKLGQYLEQFEVGGAHPALIQKFRSKRTARGKISEEFEFRVVSHLFTKVREFLDQDIGGHYEQN